MSALTDLRSAIRNTPGSSLAVFGTHTSPCLLRHGGVSLGDDGAAQVGVGTLTLLYVFPDLPNLGPDSAITVGGVPYVVSTVPRRSGDGLEATVSLEDA